MDIMICNILRENHQITNQSVSFMTYIGLAVERLEEKKYPKRNEKKIL